MGRFVAGMQLARPQHTGADSSSHSQRLIRVDLTFCSAGSSIQSRSCGVVRGGRAPPARFRLSISNSPEQTWRENCRVRSQDSQWTARLPMLRGPRRACDRGRSRSGTDLRDWRICPVPLRLICGFAGMQSNNLLNAHAMFLRNSEHFSIRLSFASCSTSTLRVSISLASASSSVALSPFRSIAMYHLCFQFCAVKNK